MKLLNLRLAIFLASAAAGVFALGLAANAVAQPQPPPPLTAGSDRSQRITQRKAAYKAQLNSVPRARLLSNCQGAQARLSNLKAKNQFNLQMRQQTYSKLTDDLAKIIKSLKKQDVAVSKLSESQSKFDSAIKNYQADYQLYKTALDDAAAMDCRADPDGFLASLHESRALRSRLAADAAAIKAALPEISNGLSAAKLELINKAGDR